MPGKPRSHTPEFKEQAIKEVVDSSPPRTMTEVARGLDINDSTLGFWVKAYRRKLAGQRLPSDMPDGETVRELERRVRGLGLGSVFLKKAASSREGAAVSEKYEFIDAECATLPVEGEAPTVVQMCEWLGVSKSGFYD